MSQGAQRALNDFAKLLSEEGLSLYATRWLVNGADYVSQHSRQHPPKWPGVYGLKNAVRELVGAPASTSVLFANRSRALAEMAIQLLAVRCSRPMIVDLLWPPYQKLAIAACRSTAASPSIVRVRRQVFLHRICAEELIDSLSAHYRRNECNGLLLPSVSHDGVRFPVAKICGRLKDARPPQLVVIDGAQGFGQLDSPEVVSAADVYLASAHKWLRAGLPLGIAIVDCPSLHDQMRGVTCGRRTSSDSLLQLLEELSMGRAELFGETVNVAPLVTCFGALQEMSAAGASAAKIQNHNRNLLVACLTNSDWQLLTPDSEMRSGIVVARARDYAARRSSPQSLSRHFSEHGVAVTCYPHGYVRLSTPIESLIRPSRMTCLTAALLALVGAPNRSFRLPPLSPADGLPERLDTDAGGA
jgi:hypothetical protein